MLRLILIFIVFAHLQAEELSYLPVSYKGRFRPLEVYSQLVVYDLTHSAHVGQLTAFDFLRTLYLEGHQSFDQIPLFFVESPELRQAMHMQSKHISYAELKNFQLKSYPEWPSLQAKLLFYEKGGAFPMLPKRYSPTEWQELSLLQGENTTAFTQKNWLKLKQATPFSLDFVNAYWEAYLPFTLGSIHLSKESAFSFPSALQLKMETWYFRWPLTSYATVFYLAALLLFIMIEGIKIAFLRSLAWTSFGMAFSLHTLALVTRAYILGRPPVSNMAETVIYVPWITSMAGIALTLYSRSFLPIASASAIAAILLTLLDWTLSANSLENVQAVLNSQLWLSIHVLMIVASYGVLILAGFLGHIYLIKSCFKRHSPALSQTILQSIYIGVALLIPGTILGGVWAAQSWGRFWDWDPKESWAFISACIYLLVVHAHRFHRIGAKGLAIGSILGLMAISFTWYGVNYILGTGLHSYGFGSGGEWIYYSYLLFEIAFISITFIYLKKIAAINLINVPLAKLSSKHGL